VIPRFDGELAAGRVGAAFVTLVRGTGDSVVMSWTPRAVLAGVSGLSLWAIGGRVGLFVGIGL
jgi:hypothetical protein